MFNSIKLSFLFQAIGRHDYKNMETEFCTDYMKHTDFFFIPRTAQCPYFTKANVWVKYQLPEILVEKK